MEKFKYNNKLKKFARANRRSLTKAEKVLWKKIRKRQLRGFKFIRQYPVNGMIYDFYCSELNLAIEVDGEYHNNERVKDLDYSKDNTSKLRKVKVLRFPNEHVLSNINKVIFQILNEIEKKLRKIKKNLALNCIFSNRKNMFLSLCKL